MSDHTDSVEPLIAKIMAINQALEEVRLLVKGKREEALKLFKATTLLTREKAAERLEISLSQIDRETCKGALPRILIDRRPRYSLADIENYVNSRRSAYRSRKSPEKLEQS